MLRGPVWPARASALCRTATVHAGPMPGVPIAPPTVEAPRRRPPSRSPDGWPSRSSSAPLRPSSSWRSSPARLLAPYVGVSLETYTGIIGIVLSGIAVGAWMGGAVADRLDQRASSRCCSSPVVRWRSPRFRSSGRSDRPRIGGATRHPRRDRRRVPAIGRRAELRSARRCQTAAARPSDDRSTVGQLSAYGTVGAIAATFLTASCLSCSPR